MVEVTRAREEADGGEIPQAEQRFLKCRYLQRIGEKGQVGGGSHLVLANPAGSFSRPARSREVPLPPFLLSPPSVPLPNSSPERFMEETPDSPDSCRHSHTN